MKDRDALLRSFASFCVFLLVCLKRKVRESVLPGKVKLDYVRMSWIGFG